MKPTNSIFTGMETTVFERMSRLAVEKKAINLGQGFPDVDGPEDIKQVAADALMTGPNQYPRMLGQPELRQAVAECNKRFYGLDVDWQTEVLVTSGATEALADCINALVEPGDEVILIEPLYDCYLPLVKQAGGTPVFVRVTPPNWDLSEEALRAAFSPKTKAILINNPMNPCAKVFRKEELQLLADLCIEHDCYAICDEVYEHIVFSEGGHTPLMALEGMRERTIRIGSAGKTFSLTGWKVGYVTAAPNLLDPIAKAHQFTTFTTPPNLQAAVAYGLQKEDDYFTEFEQDLKDKCSYLSQGLAEIGFRVLPCDGTYFVTCDVAQMGFSGSDEAFCQQLVEQAGVAAVPISAFYAENAPTHLIRFCFCKQTSVLEEALSRLRQWMGTKAA